MKARPILLLLCLISYFYLATAARADDDNPINALPNKQLQRFANTYLTIKSYYVEPVSDDKLFDGAIRGMVAGLDPHSSYLNAEDFKDLQDTANGEFNGLGMEVMQDDDFIRVVSPIDGTPAQKAGILPGDFIVKINGTLVKGMTLREAVSKMRGAPGTYVNLGILRKGAKHVLTIKVKREIIRVQSVKYRLLAKDYGYIRISLLQADSGMNLEAAFRKLKAQNGGPLKGLVLDLRNDPGGLLQAAIDVVNHFLDSKTLPNNHLIVYTRGRLANNQFSAQANGNDMLNGAPLAVLINGSSASGAEIIAGALQDYKRATIMGTRSFGKGSVQTVLPLDDDTALKLTTALYYTPLGRSIQAKGIEPDIIVLDHPINKNAKHPDDGLKESDLLGHLAGTDDNSIKAVDNNDDDDIDDQSLSDTPTASVSANDYQVLQALGVIQHQATDDDKDEK